jgi:hypothetical protein
MSKNIEWVIRELKSLVSPKDLVLLRESVDLELLLMMHKVIQENRDKDIWQCYYTPAEIGLISVVNIFEYKSTP